MNLDLQWKNGVLSPLPEVLEGLIVQQSNPTYTVPALQQILRKIGPLPEEALCLGIAEDGLPILLNLWDPLPGPILIAGDLEAGQTDFLRTISRFAVATHDPSEIQYVVISGDPHSWDEHAKHPHCIGIVPAAHKNVANLLRALTAWIKVNQNNKRSILLLIDDLDDFLAWNSGLVHELQTILGSGPAKGIWPFVTINLENFQNVQPWLQYFHTPVFGYTKHAGVLADDDFSARFDRLWKGVEFCLKEKEHWTKFWIPAM